MEIRVKLEVTHRNKVWKTIQTADGDFPGFDEMKDEDMDFLVRNIAKGIIESGKEKHSEPILATPKEIREAPPVEDKPVEEKPEEIKRIEQTHEESVTNAVDSSREEKEDTTQMPTQSEASDKSETPVE